MVITFTRKIAVEPDFHPEFFFNRIFTAGGIYFHVSVVDKLGQILNFNMTENSRKWKIIHAPQPPDWILNLQDKLDEVICQSMLS